MEQKEILNKLVSDYNEGKLSALVGAGFSKNVSRCYLNWNELLVDMYKEVYSEEIEQYYQNHLHYNKDTATAVSSEEDVKKKYIKTRLKNEDLLGLVSKYIKKRGFREAVDVYIEKRTPVVSVKKDKIYLETDGIHNPLSKSDLSAQLELVKCDKFLNIYTTNYDNLIETANELTENSVFEKEPIITSERLSNQVSKRNIIKIHGSLNSEKDTFGFDGDNNLCYIIAQEDYDTYFNKHEAFSYMMRIAMLSGKFCLLGFSGTDANYLAWLKWMREIIVKEKNTTDIKIYLISVDKPCGSEELSLFNKNHHIEVLNLWDEYVMTEIGFTDEEIKGYTDKLNNDNLCIKDYRRVVTAFLSHIRTNTTDGSETTRYSTTSDKTNEANLLNNSEQASYRQLWIEASDKLYNKEPISEVLDRIVLASPENRLCKIVYPQERIISHFERMKQVKFTAAEAELFSIAVKESGQLPDFFKNNILENEVLQECTNWTELRLRENTINGDFSTIEGDSDFARYENIIRLFFSLDFSKAKIELEEWRPTDYRIQNHSMLSSLYREFLDSAKSEIAAYIDSENIPTKEKLYASYVGNYISGEWFNRPYDCRQYYDRGYDGQGDLQAFILHEVTPKPEKPNTLGWIGTSYKFGTQASYIKKSLKYILFLLESGLLPNYYGTYFLAIQDWYVIVHNLLRYYPYPCFFYSCTYGDKNVLRRIGQEFAYCKDLLEENKTLLIKSLEALSNPDTPQLFRTGLSIISARLYMAVDEDVWFELYKKNVADVFFNDAANGSKDENLLENFKMGVGALKNEDHSFYIFKNILCHFNEAPETFCSIISLNFELSLLGDTHNQEINELLLDTINNSETVRILEFVYTIKSEICTSESIQGAITRRIDEIPEEELPTNPFLLMYMLILLEGNNKSQKRIRQKFLSTDMWHCGLMEDGSEFSDPRYIRMNLIGTDFDWTDEEFARIEANLDMNISRFKPFQDKMRDTPFLRSSRIQYLYDVKQYIEGLSEERKGILKQTYKTVEDLLHDASDGYTFENELLSDQSADISNAIKLLENDIRAWGLEANLDNFNLLLDRAMLMLNSAIKTNLGVIYHIVSHYYDELKKLSLLNRIHAMLRIYKSKIDIFETKNIDIYWVFNYLHGIAKQLEKNGYSDEATKFWLTDKWVMRFVHFNR